MAYKYSYPLYLISSLSSFFTICCSMWRSVRRKNLRLVSSTISLDALLWAHFMKHLAGGCAKIISASETELEALSSKPPRHHRAKSEVTTCQPTKKFYYQPLSHHYHHAPPKNRNYRSRSRWFNTGSPTPTSFVEQGQASRKRLAPSLYFIVLVMSRCKDIRSFLKAYIGLHVVKFNALAAS
jgi:hypothetical protein